jgi:hypothetical protein
MTFNKSITQVESPLRYYQNKLEAVNKYISYIIFITQLHFSYATNFGLIQTFCYSRYHRNNAKFAWKYLDYDACWGNPPPRGAATQRGPWSPHFWGFLITHNDASQSVGLLWTSNQLVAETSTWQHSQQTDIHDTGGIRTHDLSRRAAAGLRLRPRGHWDRHVGVIRCCK